MTQIEGLVSCALTKEQLQDPKVRETMLVPQSCRATLTRLCFDVCPNFGYLVPRDGSHIEIVPDEYERGNPNCLNLGC